MAFANNFGVGAPPRPKSSPPPPFGKKPDAAIVIGVGAPKKPMGDAPVQDDEAGETPAMESQEEYGAKLDQDIVSAGARVGIHDPAMARKAAGEFLTAVAKCLSPGGSGDEPPMGDMGSGMGEDGQ